MTMKTETKTLYIEQTDHINKGWINEQLPMSNRVWKRRSVFTIAGENIAFYTVDVDASDEMLEDVCKKLSHMRDIITMFSGRKIHTGIYGVFQIGNYAIIDGREFLLETAVHDKRCGLIFPLITQRQQMDKVTFEPLGLELPTDFNILERRLESNYVLQNIEDKEKYTRRIILMITLATSVYPKHLIWNFSDIPREITALKTEIEEDEEVSIMVPAYEVMNAEEKSFLNLDLFIASSGTDLDPHLKPIDLVDQMKSAHNTPIEGRRMTRNEMRGRENTSVRNITDLANVMSGAKDFADMLFGEGEKKVKVDRRNGKYHIMMERK